MAKKPLITHAELAKAIHYDPKSGVFRWRARDDVPKEWNTRWAGRIAGNTRKDGYLLIMINYVHYYGHHLAWLYMTGEWPSDQIDHKNGCPFDNRWENLKQGTQGQNLQNTAKSRNKTSKFLGVSWSTREEKWRAKIRVDKKEHHLGYYTNEADASAAYLAAKAHLHSYQPVPRDVAA